MPSFNETAVAGLPVPPKGNRFHGFAGATVQGKPIPRGLGVVVTANGVKSFVLNYNLKGRERRITIGRCGDWNVPRAVERARELRQDIDRGNDPLAEKHQPAPVAEKTITDIWLAWEKARARDRTKRDPVAQRGMFNRYILPAHRDESDKVIWAGGDAQFKALKKPDHAALRDHVQSVAGPMAARATLTYLSAVYHWWEANYEDDWIAPRLSGLMPKGNARERVLTADEIRALWPAFDGLGSFGIMCKLLLLTSQRRNDIAMMRWSETDGTAVRVPASRYKTEVSHEFPLSTAAAAILAAIPKRPGDDRVFLSIQFDRGKRALDKLVPTDEPWTLHDLRRTGATLMFEAGIAIDDIERVQGHAIAGQAKTYVRGAFMDKKRHAVEALSAKLDSILNPAADNVVAIGARA